MSANSSMRSTLFLTSIAAACVLTACGGGDNSSDGGAGGNGAPAAQTTFSGVVSAAGYVPGNTSGNPTIKAGYYANAAVCLDANGNGKCDTGEASTATDSAGHFTLKSAAAGQLIADVTTKATNTATGSAVASHMILRASAAQITDQGAANVVISPMSSEVQRLVEANSSAYATEKANLATRLSGPSLATASVTVSGADALGDVNKLTGAEQQAVLFEANQLANRYAYATTKLDRGDMYPDNLAMLGGDPSVVGLTNATALTAVKPTATQAPITFAQAQQAAFNIEGIPRYDNVFVIMLENHSVAPVTGTPGILGQSTAPFINKFLNANAQFSTYYSTGNPSEPNYTALGGGDDWGITDDNWWGCAASSTSDVAFAGGKASDGQPLPAMLALPPQDSAHLSGFGGAGCTVGTSTNHNIAAASIFDLLSKAGMTWRSYSESMNPGQDPRADSITDTAVVGTYTGPGAGATGALAAPGGLYKTKHHPGMAYQATRNQPEFYADNRTIFGTQYNEAAWLASTAYGPAPTGYIYDQFSADLASGDVGNLNFIMPDQCEDMHSVGSDQSCVSGSTAIVQRGDDYTRQVVEKIQASPLWKNKQRKVAIIVMFDEGEGSSTSCCGWNPTQTNNGQAPLTFANGKFSPTTTLNYNKGNHGHGNSIFGVATNQANPNIADSDAYSHFSLVRTMQDMFQVGDPQQPQSYLARARYTEAFIQANIANLPEMAGSLDTHLDSVRPMNHAYVTPATYTQRLNAVDVVNTTLATRAPGPDANQTNIWALAK